MTPDLQAASTRSTPETKNIGAAMRGNVVCDVIEVGRFFDMIFCGA